MSGRQQFVENYVLTRARPGHDSIVSQRFGGGEESRVTQAIGRLRRAGQPDLERLKRRLEQVYEGDNREAEVWGYSEFRD